jgi:uncharacterized membrane protein YgcG
MRDGRGRITRPEEEIRPILSTFRRGGLGLVCGMTPASEIAHSPAHAHGVRPFDRARAHAGRWERLLAVLGVCLPVPLLALTGLSIPLPAGVERIGAALVAWTDASVDGVDPLGLDDRGSIVLAAGEDPLLQAPSGAEPDTARRVLAASAPVAEPSPGGAKDGGTPPKDGGGGGGGGTGGSGGSGGSTGGGGGGSGGNGGGTGGNDPGDDPGLVEETVEKVTEEPLVEEVDKTVDEILPTGGGGSSEGLLDDTLSDLGL